MNRSGVACGLILSLAVLVGGAPSVPSVATAQGPGIADVLKQRLGDHPGVGIVVGLLDAQGKRTFITAGSAGEKVRGPLDGRTVFEIGSASKVFTATILADMVSRGEVRLDDPVSKYLPATVRVPERNGKAITLLSLATHTSGLPRMPTNFTPKDIQNPYADYSVQQMYDFLSAYTLTRDVGEQYEYSNLGVGLLGHALALRAGKSYEQLMIERVARPLGLRDTRITLDSALAQRLAIGHASTGYVTANWDIPTLAGAGAIRSTADDLLTFLAANIAAPDGPLGAALAQTHVVRVKTDRPGMQTGLGWVIRATPVAEVIWHNGGTGGYHSFIGFDARRHTAVVVLHNSALSIDDIGFHLLDASFPLDAKAPSLRKPRTAVAVPVSVLEGLVGKYTLTPTFVIDVTREGEQLFIQATGQPRLPVFAESETKFFLKAVDAQITFVKDAAGRVTGLVLHQNGTDQKAVRSPSQTQARLARLVDFRTP